jgi:ADP-ribose pyrophosphatase YjhB (NUDIX family)
MNNQATSHSPNAVLVTRVGTQMMLVRRCATPKSRLLPLPGGHMDQTGYLISLVDRAEQNDPEAKALLASWDKDNNPLKALHRELREEYP